MLFLDNKFIDWDNIEVVFDCDDIWLLLRDTRYDYTNLQKVKNFDIVILPFTCDYISIESDLVFDVHYKALCEYLQETSDLREDGNFYLQSPTLDTEWVYHHMPINVGGWMFHQIKLNSLGLLSNERQYKLKNINVSRHIRDQYDNIIQSAKTKYNALDRDIYTDEDLANFLCYMPLDKYEMYPRYSFTRDGLFTDNIGDHTLYIIDDHMIHRNISFTDNYYIWDLSDINNLLFRENFLVFKDGKFIPNFPILSSVNNITFFNNPEENNISVSILYNKLTDHVIKNSDKFLMSYMNEKAKDYLTAIGELVKNSDTAIYKYINTYQQMQYLDTTIAEVPTMEDYAIFLNALNDTEYAYNLVNILNKPLDFEFSRFKLYEENVQEALEKIIDYNPSLLNPLYHTSVDSKVFTGEQANESLLYKFMYEDRRGIKIPRKRYKNHETYFMIFLNGELYKEYYRTICYANFFFIPVADDFEFNPSDRIEILYFKNVNNNEIRFYLSDWLLDQLKTNDNNPNFYDLNIFEPYIKNTELKVFAHYPKDILRYPTLITDASEEIAFNISYRDVNNNLCLMKSALNSIISNDLFKEIESQEPGSVPTDLNILLAENNIDLYKDQIRHHTYIFQMGINIFNDDNRVTRNALVAVSRRKFIYQRLYVDQKSYRIELDKRFRYCDNPKQYLLFINGRRMHQNSFLITIPKHTRPFHTMYLYTARFVNPNDRIELFYLPYEQTDINYEDGYYLQSNGYLEFSDRTKLDVPLSKDLYLFFINGKKIPSTDIIDIDSNTIRVTVDTNTLHYPMITKIHLDSLENVREYLHDENRLSEYDKFINYIKTYRPSGYEELDKMLGYYTQLTDNETDQIWANVAKIAILNEVIRDFWVTSGYNYQEKLFVYDYDQDDYFERKDDGTLILPSLDANPDINIAKNEISLLYFYTDPLNLVFELGSHAHSIKFFWEYSQRFNQPWKIISQAINGISIPVDAREYEWVEDLHDGSNKKFIFAANTGHSYIVKELEVAFANGIYWGLMEEDELQYYRRKNTYQYMDELIAVIPKDGIIPSMKQQEIESGNKDYVDYINYANVIVHGLSYGQQPEEIEPLWKDPLFNMEDDSFIAILPDERIIRDIGQIKYPEKITYNDYIFDDNNFISIAHGNGNIIDDMNYLINERLTHEEDIHYRDFNILNDGLIAITTDGNEYNNFDLFMKFFPGDNDNEAYDFTNDEVYNFMAIVSKGKDDIVIPNIGYHDEHRYYNRFPDTIVNDDLLIPNNDFMAIYINEDKIVYNPEDMPPRLEHKPHDRIDTVIDASVDFISDDEFIAKDLIYADMNKFKWLPHMDENDAVILDTNRFIAIQDDIIHDNIYAEYKIDEHINPLLRIHEDFLVNDLDYQTLTINNEPDMELTQVEDAEAMDIDTGAEPLFIDMEYDASLAYGDLLYGYNIDDTNIPGVDIGIYLIGSSDLYAVIDDNISLLDASIDDMQYLKEYGQVPTIIDAYDIYSYKFVMINNDEITPIDDFTYIDIHEKDKKYTLDVDPTYEDFQAILINQDTTLTQLDYELEYKTKLDSLPVYDLSVNGFMVISKDKEEILEGDITYKLENQRPEIYAVDPTGLDFIIAGRDEPYSDIQIEYPPKRTFINYLDIINDDYQVIAQNGLNISSLGYITEFDEYADWKLQRLLIDRDDTFAIQHNTGKIIPHDFMFIGNLMQQVNELEYYNIRSDGFIYFDEENRIHNDAREMLLLSNYYSARKDIGLVNYINESRIMMAIDNNTMEIISAPLTYKVNELADDKHIAIIYEDGTVYAVTMDGREIEDFNWEDYATSWTNTHLFNIEDSDFMAILSDGRIYNGLELFYDPSRKLWIRRYFDESDLPMIISRLDKHLLNKSNIKIKNYWIGNEKYFVFACPKRLVYENGWQNMSQFFFPDLNSEEMIKHMKSDDKSRPLYTSGVIDPKTKLFQKLDSMEMEYMGECFFTNQYGYTEPYMVWKTNGYFTRLFENYGIDISIKIGDYKKVTIYSQDQEVYAEVKYVDGIEILGNELDDGSHTNNYLPSDTYTWSPAESGNTVTEDQSIYISKYGTGKISNAKEAVAERIAKYGMGQRIVTLGNLSPVVMNKQLLPDDGIFIGG